MLRELRLFAVFLSFASMTVFFFFLLGPPLFSSAHIWWVSWLMVTGGMTPSGLLLVSGLTDELAGWRSIPLDPWLIGWQPACWNILLPVGFLKEKPADQLPDGDSRDWLTDAVIFMRVKADSLQTVKATTTKRLYVVMSVYHNQQLNKKEYL